MFCATRSILFLLLAASLPLMAVSKRELQEQQTASAIYDLKHTLNLVQHRASNQQTELKTFEERLFNFETMLQALRDDVEKENSSQLQTVSTRSQSLELKLTGLEQASHALASDIKQLTTHANETANTLKTFKQKLTEIDSAVAEQNQHMESLQVAVSSILEAFQMKDETLAKSRHYQIKNGDSLEKIAKAHQTTVGAIKALNGLNSDKIVVGKTLKLPN